MTTTETLLIINSALLGLIGIMFLAIGYFLKDLHREFKKMIDRVNTMHNRLDQHITFFDSLKKVFQGQIDRLNGRIARLEKKSN